MTFNCNCITSCLYHCLDQKSKSSWANHLQHPKYHCVIHQSFYLTVKKLSLGNKTSFNFVECWCQSGLQTRNTIDQLERRLESKALASALIYIWLETCDISKKKGNSVRISNKGLVFYDVALIWNRKLNENIDKNCFRAAAEDILDMQVSEADLNSIK